MSFNEDLVYEALSYAWGDNAKTHSISLGGHEFGVTANLYIGLSSLRQTDEDRYIWIDAVCINQDDILERNQEVLRMFNIYSRATRVIVSLEGESEDSSLAISHLQRLNIDRHMRINRNLRKRIIDFSKTRIAQFLILLKSCIKAAYSLPWTISMLVFHYFIIDLPSNGFIYWLYFMANSWNIAVLSVKIFGNYHNLSVAKEDKLTIPDDNIVQALASLFSKSWFRRIWVVQEISVAQEALIVCGQDSIPWTNLCNACDEIDFLVSKSWEKNTYLETGYRMCTTIRDFLQIPLKKNMPRLDLLHLLHKWSFCKATDKRDKIYALLGLSREVKEGINLVKPDYESSVVTVYSNLVKSHVLSIRRLDILSFCDGGHSDPELPSWAPDWTVNIYRRFNYGITTNGYKYELPMSKAGTEAVARFCKDLKIMTVEGFVVGQFVNIGGTVIDKTLIDNLKAPVDPKFAFIATILMKLFKVILYFPGISTLIGVFMKYSPIIYAWIYIEDDLMAKAFLEEMDDIVRDFRAISDKNWNAMFKQEEGLRSLTTFPQTCWNLMSALDYDQVEDYGMKQVEWKSALITPTLGHWGECEVAFANPQRGDLICMFTGAKEPYVLRRRKEYYILMGSVYFDHSNLANRFIWKDCVREYTLGVLDLHKFDII
jgi:hypothetical protein